MMIWTEADEACSGDRERALRNLTYQVEAGETMGIIVMYAEAAWRAGPASRTSTPPFDPRECGGRMARNSMKLARKKVFLRFPARSRLTPRRPRGLRSHHDE
jgi:hypothetical protein